MIKIKKLWKIETTDNSMKEDGEWRLYSMLFKPRRNSLTTSKMLFPTELDCIMSAVNESQYSDLKVYNYQIIKESSHGQFHGRWAILSKIDDFCWRHIMNLAEETYLKDPEKYLALNQGSEIVFEDYYDRIDEYYIEIFMQ